MRKPQLLAFALLVAFAHDATAIARPSQSITPRTVVVPSGDLYLKAFLWTPAGPLPFLASCSVTAAVTTPSILADSSLRKQPKDSARSSSNGATPFSISSAAVRASHPTRGHSSETSCSEKRLPREKMRESTCSSFY